MAEADQSILQRAVITEARRRAIKAVKRQYQAQGLKPHHVAHREIVAAANEYLREHRELIPEAADVVERWRVDGFFGKRLRDAQNLKLVCVEQSRAALGLRIHECQTQNGSEK